MTITVKSLLTYGDSKTFETGAGSYQPYLIAQLANHDRSGLWREHPSRLAAGGRDMASGAAAIDAELAASVGTPDIVLFNLGANDADDTLVEATWKANFAYILDAFHTKWSNAHIYVAQPWRQNYAAECDALVAWMADVLAARSAWASFGVDERLILPGGDDGATNTIGGTHYSAAGARLVALGWLAGMGY